MEIWKIVSPFKILNYPHKFLEDKLKQFLYFPERSIAKIVTKKQRKVNTMVLYLPQNEMFSKHEDIWTKSILFQIKIPLTSSIQR